MKKILYLLRQPIGKMNPSVFLSSEHVGEVILLEESGMSSTTDVKESLYSMSKGGDVPFLSYEELIEKIFEMDHVIVV